MPEKEQTVWVMCASCGQESRKHQILHEKVSNFPYEVKEFHRLVECMGCEKTKYVISTFDGLDFEPMEKNFKVLYPGAPGATQRKRTAITSEEAKDDKGNTLIPEAVWKMYRETADALNAGIRTLAGAGLRAVVEAICLDKKIEERDLQKKIEELENQKLLTPVEAELLHEERYLGNAAIHELATPSVQDIEDGLGIVEGLINTIYILPSKAARLKKSREAKKKPGPSGTVADPARRT